MLNRENQKVNNNGEVKSMMKESVEIKHYMFDGSENGVVEVINTVGYYVSNYIDHMIHVVKKSDTKELGKIFGTKIVDKLLDLRSLTLREAYNIVGIVYRTSDSIVNEDLKIEDIGMEEYTVIEDIRFYCSEIVRGIEGVLLMKDYIGITESKVLDVLIDSCGFVFED